MCLFLLCLCSCPFSWGFFSAELCLDTDRCIVCKDAAAFFQHNQFVEEFSLVLDFFSSFSCFSEKSGRSNFRSSVRVEFSKKYLWFSALSFVHKYHRNGQKYHPYFLLGKHFPGRHSGRAEGASWEGMSKGTRIILTKSFVFLTMLIPTFLFRDIVPF